MKYIRHVSLSGPAFADRTAVDYIALHGSILYGKPFRFDPMDLSTAFATDSDLWYMLTEKIQRHPTIFCGYGLNDPGILEALSPSTIGGKEHEDKWILLRHPTDGDRDYFRAMGFNLIEGEILELLEWLRSVRPKAIVGDKVKSTHPVLKELKIPSPTSLAVRPIADFYSGAAPRWTDIFSGRLYKLSHYKRIKDAILSQSDVAVIGTLASGKSTLMMQLAADIAFDGFKLVSSSITLDNAKLLARVLEDSPTMLFVDDFASSAKAFEYLRGRGNIQLIGFERDFSYERVAHLINERGLKFENCSELSDEDLQELYTTVPQELKTRSLRRPSTSRNVRPTMFETVITNLVRPALKARFRPLLRELGKSEPILHDFLVMCSYVHSCRTPVSLDMAIAFLRDEVSAMDVPALIPQLQSLVVGYTDVIVDEESEFFVPRSSIIADAVLESVDSNDFRRVLQKFHANVSTLRIASFDIFRRKGFDESFATKAFPHWETGLRFYESLAGRDETYYLSQQAALYLMHRGKFQEAFKWIDKAINESRGRILSIRNSHAVILFRANIDLAGNGDPLVEETLQRSMSILAECYRDDKRRTYHAITFGDQAMKYWKAFHDDRARAYLATAVKWLREEKTSAAWHSRVPKLLGQVERVSSAAGPPSGAAAGSSTPPPLTTPPRQTPKSPTKNSAAIDGRSASK